MAKRVETWDELVATPDSFLLPEEKKVLWVHLPVKGAYGKLELKGDDGWFLIENDDGTISVQPSIDMRGVYSWHGYLTNDQFVELSG